MPKLFLMRVQASRVLTGLGVLLLPATSPEALASYALHAALPLRLRSPDGQESWACGSVEELSRAGEMATRALLLTQQDGTVPPPVGTEIWYEA